MKYAIIAVTDGNYNIHTEHANLNAAKVAYHGYCQALWNDAGTTSAMVMIVDENLDCVERYKEFISHVSE